MPEGKIQAAFIGCGSHARRNIFPTFNFAPVELVATCDLDLDRAETCRRLFGGLRAYDDHRELLAAEDLDAVFIVTDYEPDGRPKYPPLAMDCMRAGCHVWIEKPPAASVAEIEAMQAVERQTGKFVLVGFKKAFTPTATHVKDIVSRPEFGQPSSLYLRYPQAMPDEKQKRGAPKTCRGFLDHVVHPGSLLTYLAGPVANVQTLRGEAGGGFALVAMESGVPACLHFAAGQSGTSPLERLEVIGTGANVVVDNGVKLTYYRGGSRGPGGYGGAPDFIGDDAGAPLYWEPEFSLGQLYNKGLFLLGYVQEVDEFARCILNDEKPSRGSLTHAHQVLHLYELLLAT
ncbi:MAG: Gfo/Idh/MocA family protein [Armatimonadota bacterium]